MAVKMLPLWSAGFAQEALCAADVTKLKPYATRGVAHPLGSLRVLEVEVTRSAASRLRVWAAWRRAAKANSKRTGGAVAGDVERLLDPLWPR